MSTPGQVFAGPFSAQAGNEVTVALSGSTFTGCFNLELISPNGALAQDEGTCGTNSITFTYVGLGVAGSWTVAFVPQGDDQTGTASISLTGLAVTGKPPEGVVGVKYHTTFKAKPGKSPYTWAVTGSLPAGISLDASTGKVSGKPTTTGVSTFTVSVTDGGFYTASVTKTITVVEPLQVTTTSLPGGDRQRSVLGDAGGNGRHDALHLVDPSELAAAWPEPRPGDGDDQRPSKRSRHLRLHCHGDRFDEQAPQRQRPPVDHHLELTAKRVTWKGA